MLPAESAIMLAYLDIVEILIPGRTYWAEQRHAMRPGEWIPFRFVYSSINWQSEIALLCGFDLDLWSERTWVLHCVGDVREIVQP